MANRSTIGAFMIAARRSAAVVPAIEHFGRGAGGEAVPPRYSTMGMRDADQTTSPDQQPSDDHQRRPQRTAGTKNVALRDQHAE